MSAHAMDEMAEDDLDIGDVETAILNGRIVRTEKDDPRGTTDVIEGVAADRHTPVGVVPEIEQTDPERARDVEVSGETLEALHQ